MRSLLSAWVLLLVSVPSAIATEMCTAKDNSARILQSASPNDTHPDWLGESYVGLGANMKPAESIEGPGGRYVKGDLYSTRGSIQTPGAYFLAREWDCSEQQTSLDIRSKGNGSSTGKWRVSEDSNPLDDTKTVMLMLDAEEGSSRYGDRVAFVARCRSNVTEAYIVWGDYLGNDSRSVYSDWKLVTIRIGDAPAEEQRWGLSTDSKATFSPDWAGTLLKSMATTDKFVARTVPYNESPVTAVFDTTGLAEALSPLMETCGWSL